MRADAFGRAGGAAEVSPAASGSPAQRPARTRPDPRPMRLALGATGLAALSAIVTAIASPSAGATLPGASAGSGGRAGVAGSAAVEQQGLAGAAPSTVAVQRPVHYVTLQPGQTAPPGAKVIEATAPKPVTVVTRVAAPAQRPIVVRTTQSGRVLP